MRTPAGRSAGASAKPSTKSGEVVKQVQESSRISHQTTRNK